MTHLIKQSLVEEFTSGYAEGVRTFMVTACPRELLGDGESTPRLPAHTLVVEPLVRAATDIRVFGAPKGLQLPLAERQRGYLALPIGELLLKHIPEIWRGRAWSIGSVTINAQLPAEILAGIFRYCEGPTIFSSRYQMEKGCSRAALRYCEEVVLGGGTAFLFSASNGVEWLDVFMSAEIYQETLAIAEGSCRRFKRFIEHNPGRDDEIVWDRAPYSQV